MHRCVKSAVCLALAVMFGSGAVWGQRAGAVDVEPVPTHADAAVLLAKFWGLFDRYVEQDADLNECVAFLNRQGIYFGLLEVASGSEFTRDDCARVMGQINLLFLGEAELVQGRVELPAGVESWSDYCVLNDVAFETTYQSMCNFLKRASRVEKE